MRDAITDDVREHFAVVGRWDHIPGVLVDRYECVAARLVTYLAGTRSTPTRSRRPLGARSRGRSAADRCQVSGVSAG